MRKRKNVDHHITLDGHTTLHAVFSPITQKQLKSQQKQIELTPTPPTLKLSHNYALSPKFELLSC